MKKAMEISVILGISAALNSTGCLNNSSSSPAAAAPAGGAALVSQQYAGSGSDWIWKFREDGTFEAQELTTSVDINGTYRTLEAGFLKLTVTEATGPDAPRTGTEAYALEVPGVALLVKPILSFENEVITLVANGKCPSTDYTGNWIYTQHRENADMSNANQEAFGRFAWHQSGSYADLPAKYALENFASLGANLTPMSGTCADGILTIHDPVVGDEVKMYLTEIGASLVKFNSGEAVFAMPAQEIPSRASLAGSYAGLLFNANGINPDDRIQVVQGEINEAGTQLLGYGLHQIEPLDRCDEAGVSVSIDAINAPSAGFAQATVTETLSGNSGKMACMAAINVKSTGKNVFFCIGQEPNNHSVPYNVLMVSK